MQPSMASLVRPSEFPGNQSFVIGLPQTGCSNASGARAAYACYAVKSFYYDLATQAQNVDAFGRMEAANYNIAFVNSQIYCTTLITEVRPPARARLGDRRAAACLHACLHACCRGDGRCRGAP